MAVRMPRHTLQRVCRWEALGKAGCSRELFIPGANANDKHQKRTLLMNGNVLFFAVPLLRLATKAPYKSYENSTSITDSLHYRAL